MGGRDEAPRAAPHPGGKHPKHCKIKTIYCPYETGKYPAYEAFSSCDECNHEDIAALAAAAEDGFINADESDCIPIGEI